jgi:ketosteroid isomerase-like protein
MGTEQNKELVTRTWQAFTKGDLKTAFDNMSDEVSWLVPGTLPGVSGVKKGKQAIRDFIGGVGATFPEGLNAEFRKVHADGDTVIVELTNRGKTAKGRVYENEYCFVFELEGGKIRRIREYVDTQKAKEILFD